MGDSVLGLLFQISADPSKAQDALSEFEKSTGQSFDRVRGGPKLLNDVLGETDKNLLSNRESARLLSEELGIHMPRAVTSAIAEIMPAIGGMGTAMLGVFAVKEIYTFGKAGLEVLHELEGETKELKKAMQQALSEDESILRKPKSAQQANEFIKETTQRLKEADAMAAQLKKQLHDAPLGAAILAAELSSAIDAWEDKSRLYTERLRAQEDALAKFGETATKDRLKAMEASEKEAEAAEKATAAFNRAKLAVFGPSSLTT